MKYYCRICQTSIKYKTPKGWIDHIRGINHKKEKAAILKPSSLEIIKKLKDEGVLKPTEYKEILNILKTTENRTEIKNRIINVFNKTLEQKEETSQTAPDKDSPRVEQ